VDLLGHSVAGIETCIEVPGLGLLLDLGRCSRTAVNQPIVLVSHGHLDHVGAVVQHAARRAMLNVSEGTYLVPAATAPDLERLFNAASSLDGNAIPHRIVPLAPGTDFPLGKRRWVRPFPTFHRVPSQGYTVWERRHRLRAELHDVAGEKLGELRRQGVEIDEAYDAPLLSFTGDTRIEALEASEELRRVETLVMECTFVDDKVSVDDARGMGHTHLDEILARAALLPRGEVVLTHFSARYSLAYARAAVERRLPDELRATLRVLGGDADVAPSMP
jgi:ribonuclease Z